MTKLFDTIAPRYAERPGGYTRLLRLGHRRGDAAERAQVELIGSEYSAAEAAKPEKGGEATPDQPKKKTMGERLRGALGSRGKKDEAPGGGKVEKKAKGAPKKSTAPRKAGGS